MTKSAPHRLAPVPAERREGEVVGEQDGSGIRLAIACSRFNGEVTLRLLAGAYEACSRLAVPNESRLVAWVPGAFELPLLADSLARSGRFDAVVALGAVIRGETSHYDFVAGECARGLQEVQLRTGVPCVLGVLTTEDEEQALERSGGSFGNKGDDAVVTAVETVSVLRRLTAPAPT